VPHNRKPNERNQYVVTFANVTLFILLFTTLRSYQQWFNTTALPVYKEIPF